MDPATVYIDDLKKQFARLKGQCEKAVMQVAPGDSLYLEPAEHSNSVAKIIKHVGGNLRSRFTDFLISDGEKPDRNRDAEFIITEHDTFEELMRSWDRGWQALFRALGELEGSHLLRTVRIREEEMTVIAALNRSLAHIGYHTGQILYLCKFLTKDGWQWITIAPGKSEEFNRDMGLPLKTGG